MIRSVLRTGDMGLGKITIFSFGSVTIPPPDTSILSMSSLHLAKSTQKETGLSPFVNAPLLTNGYYKVHVTSYKNPPLYGELVRVIILLTVHFDPSANVIKG